MGDGQAVESPSMGFFVFQRALPEFAQFHLESE